MFKKAQKQAAKIKMSLHGAAGSGKTYSSLQLAFSLGKKVAVIDTENNSASLYADRFGEYDVLNMLPPYSPERFIEAIDYAEKNGYEVLIIDSFSSEWDGEGGCLDLQNKLGGKYQDWSKVTPRHDKLIDKILRANLHIICCMRAKTSYSMTQESGNRAKVDKLGLAPIQRDNVEYNFTICFALNSNNMVEVVKDRTGLFIGKNFIIDGSIGNTILGWLNSDSVVQGEPQQDKYTDEQYNSVVDLYSALQEKGLLAEIEQTDEKKISSVKSLINNKLTVGKDKADAMIAWLNSLNKEEN